MDTMRLSTKVLIFVNAAIYMVHLVFNGLSTNENVLFPASQGNISRVYSLEMTPVGATFTIWGFIFAFQVGWIIYTITTAFRSGPATNILSNKFFICFLLNIFCITAWLFTFSRSLITASLIILIFGEIFVVATIAFACHELHSYLKENDYSVNVDVWCVRLLVQNGILFYGTWTMIATMLNLAIVVSYEAGTTTLTASIISMSLLGGIATTWFIVESFVFNEYCEYTFASYVVLIVGLGGIMATSWGKYEIIGGLSLGLILLSILFLIARFIIIGTRACKAAIKA